MTKLEKQWGQTFEDIDFISCIKGDGIAFDCNLVKTDGEDERIRKIYEWDFKKGVQSRGSTTSVSAFPEGIRGELKCNVATGELTCVREAG